MAQLNTILILERLTQNMRRRVPESLLALFLLKLVKNKLTVAFKLSIHVPEEPLILGIFTFFGFWVEKSLIESRNPLGIFDFGHNDLVSKLLGN